MLPGIRSLSRALRLFPFLLLVLMGASLFAASPTPLPPPQPAEQLFQEKPFGPLPEATQTPPPKKFDTVEEEPIPRAWVIGGVAAAVLALAGILYGSARAWHSSNLFDQQYRFPVNEKPALRFGGQRCGGHMATIRLDENHGSPTRDRVKSGRRLGTPPRRPELPECCAQAGRATPRCA